MKYRFTAFHIVLGLIVGTPLVAQDTTSVPRDSVSKIVAISGSLGHVFVPGADDTGFGVLGFQVLRIEPKKTSSEIAFYTLPAALPHGVVVLVPEFSLVSATPLSDGWLLMKLGMNTPVALGRSGPGAMLPGLHAGIGALIPAGPKSALRLEIAPHLFAAVPVYPPIVHMSLGIVSVPGGGRR